MGGGGGGGCSFGPASPRKCAGLALISVLITVIRVILYQDN